MLLSNLMPSIWYMTVQTPRHYQNIVKVVEQDRKNIQACVNQEIRKRQKIDIFLLFQVLWRRKNTIETILSCWWLSIFYCRHGHWRPCQWCIQPKSLGGKYLTLGKQQHFCLGRHSSKHKMTRYAKILAAWPPGLPLAAPMCPALLVFMRILHTQLFFT